jgi:hypothetical protein
MAFGQYKTAKANIRKRVLDVEYLLEDTAVFSDSPGDPPLDKETVERIKKSYRLWFRSWIKDDLELITK